MSNSISEITEMVRVLLGDLDDTEPMYPTDRVDRSVRGIVRLRRVKGLIVSPNQASVTLSDGTDPTPDQFALVALHVARAFAAANPDSYEHRTRALTERFGGWSNLLGTLEEDIHALESGSMFSSWQQLDSFLQGNRGLKLGFTATKMTGEYPSRELAYPPLGGPDSTITSAPGYGS